MNKITTYFKSLCVLILVSVSFSITSQTLKSVANQNNVFVGNIGSDALIQGTISNTTRKNAQNDLFTNEYNTFVPENQLKMKSLLFNRPVNPFDIKESDLNNSAITNIRNFVNARSGLTKVRGHALIWFNQTSLPDWFKNEVGNWTAQNIYDFSESYIRAVIGATDDFVTEWDVLNEAISDQSAKYREVYEDGSGTDVWYRKVNTQANDNGNIGFDYFFTSLFSWARNAAPASVKLFYNDYSIEQKGQTKADFMYQMVSNFKTWGSPIDGVGFQSHFTLSNYDNSNFISSIKENIERLDNIGIQVAITETDFRICGFSANNPNDPSQAQRTKQQNFYYSYVKMALEQPNCDTFVVWGMSDNIQDTWITRDMQSVNGFTGCHHPTLHWGDDTYTRKEAYYGVLGALQSLNQNQDKISSITTPESVNPGASINVSINYSASQDRDVVVIFQKDTSPWTTYATVKTDVSAGSGSINTTINIPSNVPVANDEYQFQVFITNDNGSWSTKLDNKFNNNIDVIGLPSQLINNGIYFIKKSSSNLFINATNAVGSTNSVYNTNSNSAKWNFTHLGRDEYEISNVAYNSSRLEVPYPQTGNGSLVATTNWNGSGNNLIWKAVKVNNSFQFIPKHDQASALDIWEGNNTVHLWSKNSNNANQIFDLIDANTSSRNEVNTKTLKNSSSIVEKDLFNIYPNPATSTININVKNKKDNSLKIINLLGQVVISKNIKETNIDIITIDISNLKSGVYFIRINDVIEKFLKK
ncbi:endo-1,4-beta-xylanase [uncultured Polaribacter sp.]|uniref:endo-1,4-beta-xylanase n=1 Tax=uncultured Polaribacter sp. TaxID=174711 RepID=UPI00262497C6|nr:endo-1,4-beta-xylanase [uncultured Polaribacter sp.]